MPGRIAAACGVVLVDETVVVEVDFIGCWIGLYLEEMVKVGLFVDFVSFAVYFTEEEWEGEGRSE